jgi:hypothetical protein
MMICRVSVCGLGGLTSCTGGGEGYMSPAQGDGGPQHAPVLRKSTMVLIESVGSLLSSVPPHWQQEDRGRKAAESLTEKI